MADSDPVEVKESLSGLYLPGTSVQINPTFLDLENVGEVLVACGAPAVKLFQNTGLLPKQGGVKKHRGKVFSPTLESGRTLNVGASYAPTVKNIAFEDFYLFRMDLSLYRRFETTGTTAAKLGKYAWVRSFKGVMAYVHRFWVEHQRPCEICVDLETVGLHPWYPDKKIVSISITAKPGLADAVYIADLAEEEHAAVVDQLRLLATSDKVRVVGANFKFDMLWLWVKYGIEFTNFVFDTCNAGSLAEENRPNSLNVHTKIYVPEMGGYDDALNSSYDKSRFDLIPKNDLLPYAGGDTDAGLRCYRAIREELLSDTRTPDGRLSKRSLPSLYTHIVHPALKAVHMMERIGVVVDEEKFHDFGSELEGRMIETAQKAADLIPGHLLDKYGGLDEKGCAPLSKPNMIAEYLFSPVGLNLEAEMTTPTGKPSTAQHHLEQFKDHPEAGPLISLYVDYKSVAKMHGTYYVGFLKHLRPDGRWHASYAIHKAGADDAEGGAAGTVTGRGSATEPAFQCVTGDSWVITRDGVKRIADIVDPLGTTGRRPYVKHEIEVWTPIGWRKTSHAFKSWRNDLVKITLTNGIELKCTPEHPVLVGPRGGKNGQWVRARDLTPQMHLSATLETERLPAPSYVTPEAAALVGAIRTVARWDAVQGRPFLCLSADRLPEFQPYFEAVFGTDYTASIIEDEAHLFPGPSDAWSGPATWVFVSTVPGTTDPLPADLRGTEPVCDAIRAILDLSGKRTAKQLTVKADPWLLKDVQLELLSLGIVPPYCAKGEMRVRGNLLHQLSERVGLEPHPEWGPKDDRLGSRNRMKVLSVLPIDAAYVYDLTIPGEHCFYANSLIVHNTVPKHSYWGKRLRECIVCPDGHLMVGVDYSQGELKITACWANETKMIDAYARGLDLHTLTAATVNGMTYEEAMNLKKHNPDAYKDLRQNGKAGNFGLIYGMSAYGFMMYAAQAYGVYLSLEEAEAMRNAFFDLYPMLPLWHQRQIGEALQYGFVRSPLGRIRRLYNIKSPIKKVRKHAENQAVNSPIQGTLGDMMWWSMGIIEAERSGIILPCGNVHDQGLWYIPEDGWEEHTRYIKDVMENLPFEEKFGWKPQLAFTVDAEVGSSLAKLQEVKV